MEELECSTCGWRGYSAECEGIGGDYLCPLCLEELSPGPMDCDMVADMIPGEETATAFGKLPIDKSPVAWYD